MCAVAYSQVQRAVHRLGTDVPVISLEPSSLDDICATVVALGDATGRGHMAAALAAAMRERVDVVASTEPPSRPRVACLEWTDPIMVGGHWVPEMVALAGGQDPLGVAGVPSRAVTWDEVGEAEPEVMVLMPCGFGLERTLEVAGQITGRDGFAGLPCARSGRVIAVDGSGYFNRPGPRIVSGLEILAAAIRARPGDPLPRGAAWISPG